MLFLMEAWPHQGLDLLLGPQRGRKHSWHIRAKGSSGPRAPHQKSVQQCHPCPRGGHSVAHSEWTSPTPKLSPGGRSSQRAWLMDADLHS